MLGRCQQIPQNKKFIKTDMRRNKNLKIISLKEIKFVLNKSKANLYQRNLQVHIALMVIFSNYLRKK